MGAINLDNTGSGGAITLSSDGTDLLLDGSAVGGGGGFDADFVIADKTATYTVVAGDAGKVLTHSANDITFNLTAAATLGAGFHVWIKNEGASGDITTIDPSGSETLDGRGTEKLFTGESIHIYTDGSNWYSLDRTIMWVGNTATDYYARPLAAGGGAIAGGLQSSASGVTSVAVGYTASATANGSVALGSSATATANRAIALGWSKAGGTDSLAAAITSSSATYGATFSNSIAMGYRAKASSGYALAIGYQTIASAYYSVALGSGTQASGAQSFAMGYISKAEAENSTALGFRSRTRIKGQLAVTSGYFGAAGDAQASIYVLRSDTTDATSEALTADNSTPSTDNQIILLNNQTYSFHGTIVARESAASGTDCAAWKVEGLIRREGSAATTVLVNSATTVLDNTPSWGMALSADTTNGGLKIEVTGAAATNIRWVGTIHTSEVTYA